MSDGMWIALLVFLGLVFAGLGFFAVADAIRDLGWHVNDAVQVSLGDKPRPTWMRPDLRPLKERLADPHPPTPGFYADSAAGVEIMGNTVWAPPHTPESGT